MHEIKATTLLAGVVGHPIAHSLSPAIHNAAYKHDKRDAAYLAFDVDPDEFETFVDGMRAAGARGLNVTVPHKRAAWNVATTVTEEAQSIQAVNLLMFDGDEIVGDNTDVSGVRLALQELGAEVDGAKVLVIGAGGAGRAAAFALGDQPEQILITNRTAARAEMLRSAIGARAQVVTWKQMSEAAREVDVIIHATSMGLDGDATALDYMTLQRTSCSALLDLVYGASETPLVLEARRAGIPAADGLGMLVFQAAEAYALMWDAKAPLRVMRTAALKAAGRSS